MNSDRTYSTTIMLFGLLLASFVVAYFPVWKKLILQWNTHDQYSHGFFIVPISLYIIWQKRDELLHTPYKPSIGGGIVVSLALIVYLFASFAEIETVTSLSMIFFLIGAVLYLFGVLAFKKILFALLFLLFMIPIPAQIYASLTVPLQLFVSKVSASVVVFLGVPLYREGNVLHLPEQTLQVVQACSGLRSMVSLLMISVIGGYFTLKSNGLRWILALWGIPVAIFVNIIRVLTMVGAFYYFKYDLTQGSVHTIFGIVIFLIALVIIALTRGVLSKWDKSTLPE